MEGQPALTIATHCPIIVRLLSDYCPFPDAYHRS